MYPVNATAVDTARNSTALVKQEQNCTAVDRSTGESCGETESLSILNEFQRLYETRIESVDREIDGEFERASMKLRIMKEWIKDLGEQNIMLVHTVEDLEQAACSRVKLLEDKLKQSSMLISDNISKSSSTEEAIKLLSHRIGELEKDEEYMQQRIEFLQSDIRGLLELIRRARQSNCWDTDGIQFFEIQPNDIPVPLDCSCGQEETNEKVQTLKLQVEQLQENERKMIAYQTDLEAKVADLSTKLFTREKSLEKYDTQFQSLGDNLKRHSKLAEKVISNSFTANDEVESPAIVLMADIVENVLVEKDLETKSLRERLRDLESTLALASHEKDLRTRLEEKSAELNQIQLRMAALQKESLETREVLIAEVAEKHDAIMSLKEEVAALEEQCRNANMQIHFKEDIIREMRKELKQASLKDDTGLRSGKSQQAEIMKHLINVKSVIEKEKEALSDIKIHLEELCFNTEQEPGHDIMNIYKKFEDIEILLSNYKSQITHNPECASELKNCIAALELPLSCLQNMFQSIFLTGRVNELDKKNITQKIMANIDIIAKLHSEKDQSIETINSMVKAESDICTSSGTTRATPNADNHSRYKVIDTLEECSVEVQTATDEIREEIGIVISAFNSQYQKFTELNHVITNVQDQLATTRERLMQMVNRLQLQEDERIRHNERLATGKLKLKDIKNEINHAQLRLSARVSDTQESVQENAMLSYTEACICNDLLSLVLEEMDEILSNFALQTQGCYVTSAFGELKSHLYEVDSSIKGLQRKMDGVLLENDVTETFFEKERKLEKLETDVSCACTKMQSVLFSTIGQSTDVSHSVNSPRRPKHLVRLRREYDDSKQKTSQKTSYIECNEKSCQWKCRVVDLQDQVRVLKHEVKCKQEANNFLRSNIEAMEEELRSVQVKAENYRRSHSVNSMELKKKIIELENTIKMQRETESTLRQHLNDSEIELKRSKDLLNSFNDHGIEGMLLHYGCNQFKNEATNIPQLFETIQSAMQTMKRDLHDLAHELKKLICEGTSHSCTSTRSIMTLIDKLEKYEAELNNCSQEVAKLKNVLYSKDKLLENMDEIIRIQKDSITMTQAELKEIHQKLQEKIDTQDRIITQYEKDKTELLKQNELQVQTIGHLQNAVVEAKKCIDHMGQKTITDLQEKTETIRVLTIYVDETQSQYNECFAEAAKQDGLMELQRDAIAELQKKIHDLEHDRRLTEQLEVHVKEFQAAKSKIDALVRSNSCWETKYLNARKSWQETEEELQELRKTASKKNREEKTYNDKTCQCEVAVVDKDCLTEDIEYCNAEEEVSPSPRERELQSENDALIKENEDIKRQLERWKLDIDIIDEELKIERENDDYAEHVTAELQRLKKAECCLRSENEQLKFDLENRTKDTEDVLQQINHSYGEITRKTAIIRQQAETIKDLQEKLDLSQERTMKYASDLNAMEKMRTALRDRLESLKVLLKEKSDHVVKLQADYEMLKNDYTILRTENSFVESRAKEDISQLKKKLKEVQQELCFAEDNYRSVTQDFSKTQEQLIQAAKREADLQESMTNIEKDCSSKIICAGKEEARLRNLVDTLTDELEDVQRNYTLRNSELCQAQEMCNSYAEKIEVMQQHIKREKEKIVKIEDSNRRLIQQLQECIEQNCTLVHEKTLVEENSCKIMTELEGMHKSLLELKKECQLKSNSLACISAELTQTAMSRSELCNESQYVVSCIRVYMEEQEKHVENLISKLKFKQQQLIQLCFEKKALLVNIRELRRDNNLLTQRLKRTCRAGRGIKNVCAGCYLIPSMPQSGGTRIPLLPNYQRSHRKCTVGPIKTSRRTSKCGNPWWFPKMEYLTNELRKNNVWCNENFSERANGEIALEESRDCGYQSSNSK